jgi:hypothetical protein
MLPHLRKCAFVDPATRARAELARDDAAPNELAQPHQPRSFTRTLSHSASWSHPFHPPLSISTTWPSGPSGSATPSPLPSPLLLPTLLNPDPSHKRRCTLSVLDDSPSSGRTIWTPAMQSEFGEDLCRLFITIRAPWNSANNPETHLFVQKWIPGGVVPDRRTLSGPILDREAAKVEARLKAKLQGRLATFTTDGWKNKAKQSIVASMVSVASEVSQY